MDEYQGRQGVWAEGRVACSASPPFRQTARSALLRPNLRIGHFGRFYPFFFTLAETNLEAPKKQETKLAWREKASLYLISSSVSKNRQWKKVDIWAKKGRGGSKFWKEMPCCSPHTTQPVLELHNHSGHKISLYMQHISACHTNSLQVTQPPLVSQNLKSCNCSLSQHQHQISFKLQQVSWLN